MSTTTELDQQLLDALDFDIPCGVRVVTMWMGVKVAQERGCEHPAVARMRCRECGFEQFICAEHIATWSRTPRAQCGRCLAHGEPRQVFEILPLGGVS